MLFEYEILYRVSKLAENSNCVEKRQGKIKMITHLRRLDHG